MSVLSGRLGCRTRLELVLTRWKSRRNRIGQRRLARRLRSTRAVCQDVAAIQYARDRHIPDQAGAAYTESGKRLCTESVASPRGGGQTVCSCPPPLTLARLDPEIIENPSRNFSGGVGVGPVGVYRVRFYFQIGLHVIDKLITELQGRFADELVDFCCLDPRYFGMLDGEQQLRRLASRYRLDQDTAASQCRLSYQFVTAECRRRRCWFVGSLGLQASTTDIGLHSAEVAVAVQSAANTPGHHSPQQLLSADSRSCQWSSQNCAQPWLKVD